MYDVHVIDVDHPRDAAGQVRMRTVADTLDTEQLATAAGVQSCVDALTRDGSCAMARDLVPGSRLFRNTAKVAAALEAIGALATDAAVFWVHDTAAGAMQAHRLTAAQVTDELTRRGLVQTPPLENIADTVAQIAVIAGAHAVSTTAVRAALRVLGALDDNAWAAPPRVSAAGTRITLSWVRPHGNGAGRYSFTVGAHEAILARTLAGGSTTSAVSIAPADVDTVFLRAFADGVFPEISEEADPAA
ncbi:Uncharacterised protein (plasmid) [Tsukamurella tyrosinosolvens]|uniref:EspG family protein n=1 Tax=Tsukamurella tyrosinosolvens TaxID=57704 RepID=A0A1H4UIH4_TSUTY|nr:hypothetical protein [Tsukamurella tyrosinosolvens]KXO92908.1 hypothetical protein AXK58_13620 [Tsukamurella tyrosinosolvens]SEC68517.1 hypothetical protein SAMN04489793_2914 [Tsukamurella tyrosinosolvens]VEH94251.1 Uncharacterised protein [Tsukamurella tyrosinosolvens]